MKPIEKLEKFNHKMLNKQFKKAEKDLNKGLKDKFEKKVIKIIKFLKESLKYKDVEDSKTNKNITEKDIDEMDWETLKELAGIWK